VRVADDTVRALDRGVRDNQPVDAGFESDLCDVSALFGCQVGAISTNPGTRQAVSADGHQTFAIAKY